MTGNDVIAHSRRLLNDTSPGEYRWPKATLILYLNTALHILYAFRPDLKLQSNGTIDTDDTLSDGSETLLPADKFKEPLAKLVAAYALQEDGVDSSNMQIEQMYEQQFSREVTM